MSSTIEWDFKKGHCFAALAGTYILVLALLAWLSYEGQYAYLSIYVRLAFFLGIIIANLLLVMMLGLLHAPWSYLLFRIVNRFKKPNLFMFITAGVCCVIFTFYSLELLSWTGEQFGMEYQEEIVIFVIIKIIRSKIILMTSIAISGGVGGAAFYYLGKKHPASRSTETIKKKFELGNAEIK